MRRRRQVTNVSSKEYYRIFCTFCLCPLTAASSRCHRLVHGRDRAEEESLAGIELLMQDRCFLFLREKHSFAFYIAFFSPRFHGSRDRQAEGPQAQYASHTHEQGGPGVGKEEHSSHFVRWQSQ